MKKQIAMFVLLCAVAVWSGCASTPEPVAIPKDPSEKLLWSSASERPGWTVEEPNTKSGVMWFVGLSQRLATEKLSRDDAERHAGTRVVRYMGTIVKDKYEKAATSFGLASDVVDPTESARQFEKQLAINIAKQMKVKNWYVEKWQTRTGIAYQTFALAHVSQNVVDQSQRSTAEDLAKRAEKRAKAADDEVAKAQAEKASEFWKKMQEKGVAE